MDNQQPTKMPKPFDGSEQLAASSVDGNQPHFEFQDDDRLKQEDEYRQEMLKVQDEIITLRQVLGAKLKRESELKTLLGVGFVDDLKQDWNETVHDIKATTAYQKTAETLQAASDKITPAFQTVNTTLKSRLGTLKNSSFFRTFESTLGSGVNAVKSKITPSKSAMHFNGNEDNEFSRGAAGASLTSSVTLDERLNFGGDLDEKKDLSNK